MEEALLPRLKIHQDPSTPRHIKKLASGYLVPRTPKRSSALTLVEKDTVLPLLKTPKASSITDNVVTNYFNRSSSAPPLCTDEKGVIEFDCLDSKHRNTLTSPKIISLALFGLLLYITIGVTVLTFSSQNFGDHKTNKFVDALYFTVVTLTTIGYGDIVPATTFTKLFTCVFILVGFGFIDILLNGLLTYVLDRQEEVLLGAVDQNMFNNMVRKYIIDKKKGRMRIRIKICLALGVVILCLTIGTITVHFVEELNWVDSFYMSVTSVTTVGYGDYSFKTAAGKCFAIIWLLASTLAVARAFLYIVEYRIEKRNRRTANEVLHKKLTLGDLVAADLDHDGSISKAEYVVFKLREMGKISENEIEQICEQFDEIEDSHHHCKITVADLMDGDTESDSDFR